MRPIKQLWSTIPGSLLALILVVVLSGTRACPSAQCSCQQHNGRFIIKCSDRDMDAVPAFTAEDTIYDELTLANNRISTVPDDAFKGLNIKYLDLSNNPIDSVAVSAFRGLEALTTTLVLHVNRMTELPTEALSTLGNLQSLELKGFAMSNLPEKAFENLSNLETLTLDSCGLGAVRGSDFTEQQTSLSELNLPNNALTSVPTEAIASLHNLITLNLAQNQIATIASLAFKGVNKLQLLDMSQNGVTSIADDSFADLSATLQELRMHNNHLQDREILPLRVLTNLRVLDLSYNAVANIPTDFFSNMQRLTEADFTKNSLSIIRKSMFGGLRGVVKILRFVENEIEDIESGAFEALSGLQELHLDQQRDLSGKLDEGTFRGLEESLRLLSISEVGFSNSNWPAVKGLTSLRSLYLNNNNIVSVPDSMFLLLTQLTTLDLSYNSISQLSQQALRGLGGSLTSVNLENNDISSLDNCVFYQFDKLDTIRLKDNPLHCDCRLRWLRAWLERYTAFELLAVTWRCASPTQHANAPFAQLSETVLTCETPVTIPECHDLRSTTTTTPQTTTTTATTTTAPHQVWPKTLFMNISDVADTAVTVLWFVNGTTGINGFTVDHQMTNVAIEPQKVECPGMARQCTVTGLDASTTYIICVTLWYNPSNNSRKVCEDVTTKVLALQATSDDSTQMQIILGSILGVIVLVAIVGVISFLMVRRRRRQQENTFFSTTAADGTTVRPRVGYNSKRFSKPKTHTVDLDNESNKQLEKKLEGFSEEERNRIFSILAQPGDCTNTSRTSDTSQRYVPELPPRNTTTDGYMNPVSLRDEEDPHIYFEIPAEGHI